MQILIPDGQSHGNAFDVWVRALAIVILEIRDIVSNKVIMAYRNVCDISVFDTKLHKGGDDEAITATVYPKHYGIGLPFCVLLG